MKIRVKNYRALVSADLELAPLALVAAHNEGGKTSLAHAVASVMLGQAVVLDGVKASEAGSLVHAGAAKAELSIEGPGGIGSIAIPPSRYSTKGERPPRASRYALGLDSLVWLDSPTRSRVLLEYLKTAPTKEDLAKALDGTTTEVVDKIWKGVETMGWDGAHQRAVETGQKLKGQWEQVTNDRFGTVRMMNWIPEGWSEDLASASLESLQGELTQAKEFLEASISASAVSAEERSRLKTTVANEGVLQDGIATQEEEVRRAENAEARKRLAPAAAAVSDLKARIAKLRETLKLAGAATERKAVETQALGLTGARNRLTKAKQDLAGRQSALKDAQDRRRELGEPGDAIELPEGIVGACPHCKKPVMYCNGNFTVAPSADAKAAAAESKARRSKIADADETVTRCQARVTEAERMVGAIEAEVKRAQDAETKLSSMPKVECEMSAEEAQRAIGVAEAELQNAERAAEKLATLPEETATQTHDEALRLLGQLQAELKEVETAKAKLAALPESEESGGDVNQCRERVRLAEQRLQVWKQRSEADRIAGALKLNLDIVAALATTGVRQQKLVEKFTEFNAVLKALCTAAGWKPVEIDPDDIKTSYGGWRYSLLSEGAKYRVRTILQVAMAQMDGSDLLVFDGADILDGGKPLSDGVTRGRPGLIKLLATVKIPALVLMTEKREAVADLARMQLGKSYWLSGGVLEPLTTAAQQAA